MATYYQGAGGNDGNAGTSWALRFATFQQLIDTVTNADTGYTSGDSIGTMVDIDTNVGTSAAPIKIMGCDSSGNPLNGDSYATISASGSITALISYADETDYYLFEDIDFDGNDNATYCVVCNGGSAADATGWQFKHCKIHDAISHGMYVYIRGGSERPWTLVDCEIYANGGQGFCSPTTVRCHINLLFNKIHHNQSHGGTLGASGSVDLTLTVMGNVFYRNGEGGAGSGLLFDGTNPTCIIMSNTFFKNADDGLEWDDGSPFDNIVVMYNNIFHENGGYGINANGNAIEAFWLSGYNCSNGNTSGHIDINGGTLPGYHNQTTDPTFVSETDGSEDLTLQSGSDCIDAGKGYNG